MPIVAAVQMCSTEHVAENLIVAEKLISLAAKESAKLIVLPENFAMIGLADNDKLKVKENFKHGKIQTFLSAQAKKHRVWIVGGTIPIATKDPNKVRAASLVFDDRGQLVARYDKIHLFDVTISSTESYKESLAIEPGHELVVVKSPFGNLGLGVCYDIRFPEMFRYLFNKGTEIFVIPSAFTVTTGKAHWELLARTRAVENFSYVIGACQGGEHRSGRKTFGHSLIVDPWGTVIAKQAGTESGVISANIDLPKLHEIRKSFPVAKHQKIFFDLNAL